MEQETIFITEKSNTLQRFAEVIIPLALPKNYTWAIPAHLVDQALPGVRVEVVLGKNKKYAGVIKQITEAKPRAFDPKEILNVLDEVAIVSPEHLRFWQWMASYYLCSEGEVMQAALPTHFKLSSETVLLYNEEAGEDFSQLDNDEFVVAEALLIKKELRLTEVQQVLDVRHVYPVIKRLIEKKVCFVWEELKATYQPKQENYVLLNPDLAGEDKLSDLLNNWSKAPKQLELLLAYLHLEKSEGEVTSNGLLKKSGANAAQLKGLVNKGVLRIEKRNVDRIRMLPKVFDTAFEFSEAQQEALKQVHEVFHEKPVCLLHGVTSSGKTLLYVRLIEEAVKAGKQVLYLLPEIALTAQIIRRLQKYFGGYIHIYHSKFNHNERLEIWNKVASGEAKIILGARSALFLPFRELGLVVVDEEHDSSYKQQDPAPRYNARDAAIYFASLFNAKVLLGSATPSLESYFNCLQQKYGLVTLSERYGGVELPRITIVDVKQVYSKDRERQIISPTLQQAITDTIERNKQVILFQNRRGYSPYQVCQVCGWIPHCNNCDVSLTFHKLHNKLVCHYCGTKYPVVTVCEACGNHHFIQQNFGTERIEEHLQEVFPDARIARMDIDTVRGKNAHDNLIQQFEQSKLDILVGTQMVVKGLDFDNVMLVGIIDGDAILGFADFRVNERGFQLMEQVSGRAGRKEEQGNVMIQMRNTRHPVLQYVQSHDFVAFAMSELESRKNFFYPPFSRMIRVTLKHKEAAIVAAAAKILARGLHANFSENMIGPAEPVVNRIRNQYLMELLLKLPKDGHLIQHCKLEIQQQTVILHNDKTFRSVSVVVDVDPI